MGCKSLADATFTFSLLDGDLAGRSHGCIFIKNKNKQNNDAYLSWNRDELVNMVTTRISCSPFGIWAYMQAFYEGPQFLDSDTGRHLYLLGYTFMFPWYVHGN